MSWTSSANSSVASSHRRGSLPIESCGTSRNYPSGTLSDSIGRRPLVVGGLLVQAAALVGFASLNGFIPWAASAVVLGIGTAAVYPTLIAQVGDLVSPQTRASAIGRYRLWRDLGYAVGALTAGLLTDLLNFRATILIIAFFLVVSSAIARVLLPEPTRSSGHVPFDRDSGVEDLQGAGRGIAVDDR